MELFGQKTLRQMLDEMERDPIAKAKMMENRIKCIDMMRKAMREIILAPEGK
jgi:predicted nucleic acid-binding OB-fold protein